jgi:ParB/RepB/Spo0J family partition protein
MSQVDKLQDAEEQVAQMREEATRAEREAAVSIKETGRLHPPLVRTTDDGERPYELLAGRRRFAAMKLLDDAEGERADWRFTVVDGISRREALTMQFAENFHQNKPEPVQFARAARAIMAEDPALTAADVSRLVGASMAWTRKALRLLDLPEAIVQRVEKGDLSFTVADVVRRGIARGDVSPEAASDLVRKHAEGEITGGALKLGVGYVPPKPKGYEELSRKLDEARWAASRGERADEGADAEQRDWESSAGSGSAAAPGDRGRASVSAAPAPAPRRAAPDVPAEDLDAYVVGLVLARVAPPEYRRALDITDEASAHRYAFSLRPGERLSVLRTLAAELAAADPEPPRALRARLAA